MNGAKLRLADLVTDPPPTHGDGEPHESNPPQVLKELHRGALLLTHGADVVCGWLRALEDNAEVPADVRAAAGLLTTGLQAPIDLTTGELTYLTAWFAPVFQDSEEAPPAHNDDRALDGMTCIEREARIRELMIAESDETDPDRRSELAAEILNLVRQQPGLAESDPAYRFRLIARELFEVVEDLVFELDDLAVDNEGAEHAPAMIRLRVRRAQTARAHGSQVLQSHADELGESPCLPWV